MRSRAFALAVCFALPAAAADPLGSPPPGTVRTSWVGNTFGGSGGPNGFGYWVQNAADEIDVTPDGTVVAGVDWDEAGRCLGLYKDGKPNRKLVQAPQKLEDSAWGWGTGNNALAAAGDRLFVANKGKKLLRFRWTPGDIESVVFEASADLPAEAVGLAARGDTLAVVYPDKIELRSAADLRPAGGFPVKGVTDAALAADGRVWVLAGNEVRLFAKDGTDTGVTLPDPGKPTAIAFGHADGRLVVCDDGPRQQVRFYDVTGPAPKLAGRFGKEGGLSAGTPGEPLPDKLFALRGAGTDKDGNLYVSMSFGQGPLGTLTLRSFAPDGKLRWEQVNHSFVDTYGFDPDSDGTVVYGRTHRYDLDLTRTEPGTEWSVKAVTVDPQAKPTDERIKSPCTVIVRNPGGRRLLYTIGQYGGGYRLFAFPEPDGLVAKEVDRIFSDDKWAWDVAANGDIWWGDAPDRTVRRYKFGGWADGKPKFDWKKPESWKWPDGWQLVRRVIYDDRTDSLYLFGYLTGQEIDSWGVVGRVARRYDGWTTGSPKLVWTKELPVNPNGEAKGQPLTPESVAVAGDYLFVGMCKPEDSKQYVHIYRLVDAGFVGSLWPGESVGGQAGWLDMPYAVQAVKRKDGEYLLLVEEDFRGKNLLYRWRPEPGR